MVVGWLLMIAGMLAGCGFFAESPSAGPNSTVVNYGVMNEKTNGCIGSGAIIILGGIIWATGRLIDALESRP